MSRKSVIGTVLLVLGAFRAAAHAARLVIDPQNPSTLYRIWYGVEKSVQGGVCWQPINNGRSTLPATALAIDTQGTLYAAAEKVGVDVTTDGGLTWHDDGNQDATDGCTNWCTRCGNGLVTPPEECEDGVQNGAVACTTGCTTCGNGILTPPESCDDGNRAKGDGTVSVEELIAMVNAALGAAPSCDCTAGDSDGNGEITIDEIIRAVNAALTGCD